MQDHGIGSIDLLCVNLYPFEQTLESGGSYDELVENIDIGGPAMTRAAAKNHADVTTLVDPSDYADVLEEMNANGGATLEATRRRLAAKAFARTAAYDSMVSSWLLDQAGDRKPPLTAPWAVR
jgi:phosphoribosylaminoimidazolecarboxamide formyltransferase/IMP cyclohydrolase